MLLLAMYGVKFSDKVAREELRDRLGLEVEDVVTVLQRDRLRWYGHVLRKGDSEWAKKCMDFWLKVLGLEHTPLPSSVIPTVD